MNTRCPKCETVFRVDPAKVPPRGVRARCSVCSGVFFVGRPAQAPEPAPMAPGPMATPAPSPAAALTQPMPPVTSPMAPPAGITSRPVYPRAEPAAVTPPRPALPAMSPRYAPLGQVAPAVPVVPASRPAPVAMPVAAPPVRKVLNPFLAQDPATKARRLARALISDLVVYHPAKRADGLRDGTLKLLFDDEIKKCWDEYTEQVGLEMATSMPYFTEALNEILADGQPVFS